MSDPFSWERIQAAYDAAADKYEDAFGDDLARLPLDRQMLERANEVAGERLILDIGCGTGSAGSYLSNLGARVVGLDLSLGMLSTGKRHSIRFSVCQGDMRQLPFGDGQFAVTVAYYSVHNVARHEVGSVLGEAARVLIPRGTLLIATHLGEGEVFTDKFLGHKIATTGGTLYSEEQIINEVSSAGFEIEMQEIRESLPHEHESRRIYLTATRAA